MAEPGHFEVVGSKKPLFNSADMQNFAVAVLKDVGAEGQRMMATYPAQNLNKTNYRRTGTLKRSWNHEVSVANDKITLTIGSQGQIAPYNAPVQGKPQSRVFMGTGWRTVDELIVATTMKANKGMEMSVKAGIPK